MIKEMVEVPKGAVLHEREFSSDIYYPTHACLAQ